MGDDSIAYLTYLQKQILSEDLQDVFNSKKLQEWADKNKEEIANLPGIKASSNRDSLIQRIEKMHSEFVPSTNFEVPHTNAIFEPQLKRVQRTAKRIGIKPTRQIRIATSTNASVSPVAMPTSGEHLLFIGFGTSVFCNYWAKAYAFIFHTLDKCKLNTRIDSVETFKQALGNDVSGVVLAARLAFFYAFNGTLLGFDRVKQPDTHMRLRVQLLDAMEIFAVAHEFAHFVAEETFPESHGMLEPENAIFLENFCDQLGTTLTTECSKMDNFFGFFGAGAIMLLRSAQVCSNVREHILIKHCAAFIDANTSEMTRTSTHPNIEDRILTIKSQIIKIVSPDQKELIERCFTEYDDIAKILNQLILESIASVFEKIEKKKNVNKDV